MTIEGCEKKHQETMQILREINDRLYKDNGKLSIQTRLDRGDRILGMLVWVTTIAGGAVIVAALAYAWRIIVHVGV